MNKLIILVLFLFFTKVSVLLANKSPEVGIEYDKYLGQSVDLNLSFTDADGNIRKLKDIITKPTVLSLVYYNCPGICSPQLTSLAEVIGKVSLVAGKNYHLLTISFDPREDYMLAKRWKSSYLENLWKPISSSSWDFMVGDSLNIAKLTDEVGFRYKFDGKNDFIHSGALIFLDKNGKIVRYLLGTEYIPFDFELAVYESIDNKPTYSISNIMTFFYNYDTIGRTYLFSFGKSVAVFLFVLASMFLIFIIFKGRKKLNS